MNKDMCVRCGEGVVNIRVGAIIIKDDKVLMVKNDRDDYYYSVGGRIQFGETAEQAVKREVKEELGREMEVDRLGFIGETYFYGTIRDDQERLIYELAFHFYMKVPDDLDLQGDTFFEDGTPQHLEWVPLDTDKVIYPEFFKTELRHPVRETRHIVADER
ncbi:MAG: NUDIX domain-containing protein [Clostridia bacterium]|nr:NUDIX domain-containing protein [Clostridia bacterium]